jgi:hypothetical protein
MTAVGHSCLRTKAHLVACGPPDQPRENVALQIIVKHELFWRLHIRFFLGASSLYSKLYGEWDTPLVKVKIKPCWQQREVI